jgi:hypothetical protein
MSYDCVVVNGCSYSAPADYRVYGNFIADHYNAELINLALDGSNNQRILRTTLETVARLRAENRRPLVLIGWTFIRRQEVWYHGEHKKLLSQIPDHPDSRFVSLDFLFGYNEATLEQKVVFQDNQNIHKLLMDFYTDLYMFAHTLESLGVDYCFFSGADNTPYPIDSFTYLYSLAQTQWVVHNPHIMDMGKFCIARWGKENDSDCNSTGHLSENGHKKFADLILENLGS